jgi:hypothetical protein
VLKRREKKSMAEGCQIFLGATYQNGKIYQKAVNIPKGHKIYQKAIIYTKRPKGQKIYQKAKNIPKGQTYTKRP